MIRVLVCDDHQIVRQGLRQMLADANDGASAAGGEGIAVAAEADRGAEAVRLVRALHAQKTPIDVVLMDIAMPQRDGLDVLKQLKGEFPKLAVLMLSTFPDKQYAVRCLKLGAAGYLNKSADSEQMSAAIRKVAAGGLFITPVVAEQLAGALSVKALGKAGDEAAPHERLSHREYQVLRLLAAGRSVGEIAEQLSLASNTISTYRARILEKTGARNDVELALYAVRQELQPL
ncbi:MAG TPA: response regulator transcription factor [Methylibium sp.]|uniref:response regulator transcription factor n=1 Tax=Methylibium sp. TaxID=2067992 RepID=UPI002DB7E9BC|nr:response regulator transcription factor [Methylibium sp.]HEU4458963.1 response regulator transcription factor [Methylibium sp.]